MAAKLTRLTHKIAIQLYLVAESCTICNSRSRRRVRKHLDTASYFESRGVKSERRRCFIAMDFQLRFRILHKKAMKIRECWNWM